MKHTKTKSNKKALKLAALLLAVLLIILVLVMVSTRIKRDTGGVGVQDDSINYSPPTEEEQRAGDDIKLHLSNGVESETKNSPDIKKTISVIITDAGQYDDTIEVRAFIPNHYQDGTCTITFTHNSYTVKKTTPAYRDVSTTICTNPLFSRSEFPTSGEWTLVVTYSSTNAQGKSENHNIRID